MATFGIDASSANKPQKTGVEWHAYHVIQAMKAVALKEGERVVLFSPTPLTGDLAVLPAGWESRVLKWSLPRGWMQGRVSWEMFRRPTDVLFVPGQGLPMKGGKRATVNTVHDLGFRRFPNLYDAKARRTLEAVTRRAIAKSTKLFTVSEFTKRELVELYRVPETKILVTPNAADRVTCRVYQRPEIEATLQKHRLSNHYFLFVGRLELKKNIPTIIRAFEQFKAGRGIGDPFELVFVGNPGYGFNEIKTYWEGSVVKDQIRSLGYLPDEDVGALMSGSTAYLFPSWYEGFGIPNLEAMACGVPLITSDIPPHREVAGDAALFVPPAESEAWTKAMRRIVEEFGLREQLVANGMKNMERYSWTKTAEAVWSGLRSLV